MLPRRPGPLRVEIPRTISSGVDCRSGPVSTRGARSRCSPGGPVPRGSSWSESVEILGSVAWGVACSSGPGYPPGGSVEVLHLRPGAPRSSWSRSVEILGPVAWVMACNSGPASPGVSALFLWWSFPHSINQLCNLASFEPTFHGSRRHVN